MAKDKKSTFVSIKGKAMWAQVFPENKDATGWENELASTGGQYCVWMDLDEDSKVELGRLGSQALDYPREMEDNHGDPVTVYRFKRFHEKYDRSGNLLEWASGAPKVKKADGTAWNVEEDGFIGNGSELELRVCVYKAGRVIGTRLEEIKVLDLVEPPVVEVA